MCGVRVEGKHPWPTCLHHYELSTENASLYTWVWGSMQHPHGGVHAWLGGVLDCEEMHNDYVKWVGEDLALQLAYYGFIHRKYLYRSGIFKCSEPADADLTAQQVCISRSFLPPSPVLASQVVESYVLSDTLPHLSYWLNTPSCPLKFGLLYGTWQKLK